MKILLFVLSIYSCGLTAMSRARIEEMIKEAQDKKAGPIDERLLFKAKQHFKHILTLRGRSDLQEHIRTFKAKYTRNIELIHSTEIREMTARLRALEIPSIAADAIREAKEEYFQILGIADLDIIKARIANFKLQFQVHKLSKIDKIIKKLEKYYMDLKCV